MSFNFKNMVSNEQKIFLNKKIGLSVKIQLVAWSVYWASLLLINVLYFRRDDYPMPLVILWTILYTLSGAVIFFLLTKVYDYLVRKKTSIFKITTISILLLLIASYVWRLFEPIVSWIINPNIKILIIEWDINASGVFPVVFIMAFFGVLFVFGKNIEQAKTKKNTSNENTEGNTALQGTVSVYHKNEIVLLPILNIKKISVDGNYSTIIDNKNKKFELKKTLKSWETELPAGNFKRIHRSTLVNAAYIEKIELWHNYTYRIKLEGLDEPEEVSRRYAAILKKQMNL